MTEGEGGSIRLFGRWDRRFGCWSDKGESLRPSGEIFDRLGSWQDPEGLRDDPWYGERAAWTAYFSLIPAIARRLAARFGLRQWEILECLWRRPEMARWIEYDFRENESMWIFLKDAFLSIVADEKDQTKLKVRARFEGDIERVFPGAEVITDRGTDYKFRAWLPRERVAAVFAEAVMNISAVNFKSSVNEPWRHDVYMNVWNTLYRAQENRVRGTLRK